MTITDSSQGGGGIFVHAWGHNLQIANNRVYNNTGTLSGGITIGQGEIPRGVSRPGSRLPTPDSRLLPSTAADYRPTRSCRTAST